jgi:proteasome lid subunit RPN8/RPN11
MQNQELNKPLKPRDLDVISLSNCPKLIIPQEVSNKIKLLCGKISLVEWSGVLFYSVKGSIKQFDKVEFTIEDIYPMNKGTKAYTEYDLDDDLIDYRMNNPQSLGWKIGMVHSHNSMKSYFSGTDMSELNDNSEFHNYYLSLIVNNFEEMVAKVAFRGNVKGYECKDETGKNWNLNLKNTKQIMFTFDCDIVVKEELPFVENSFSDRLEEIIQKAEEKEELARLKSIKSYPTTHTSAFGNVIPAKNPYEAGPNGADAFLANRKFISDDDWFDSKQLKLDDFDTPPITNRDVSKMSHEEKLADFTAFILRLGHESPLISNTPESALEDLDAGKVNTFEFTAKFLNMYPALFEQYWDGFGQIDTDFFRLVTEDVMEILEESFDTHEVIEHLLSGLNIMLNRLIALS